MTRTNLITDLEKTGHLMCGKTRNKIKILKVLKNLNKI